MTTSSNLPRCQQCQNEVANNAKFCPNCGKPTGVTRCTQCQAELAHDGKFCPKCGATIAELHSTEGAGGISSAYKEDSKRFSEMGASAYQSGDFELAIKDFDEAIRLDPANVPAHYQRSHAYGELGQYKRAIADLDECIRLYPQHPHVYRDKATLYEEWGHPKQAKEARKEDRKLEPNTSRVWSVLNGGWSVLKFAASTLVIILVGWFAWSCVGAVDETISTWDEDTQRYEDEWEAEVQEEADRIERETREWKAQNPIPSY